MKRSTLKVIKEITESIWERHDKDPKSVSKEEFVNTLGIVQTLIETDVDVMLLNAQVGDIVTDNIFIGDRWEIIERVTGHGLKEQDFKMKNLKTGEFAYRLDEDIIDKDFVKILQLEGKEIFSAW